MVIDKYFDPHQILELPIKIIGKVIFTKNYY